MALQAQRQPHPWQRKGQLQILREVPNIYNGHFTANFASEQGVVPTVNLPLERIVARSSEPLRESSFSISPRTSLSEPFENYHPCDSQNVFIDFSLSLGQQSAPSTHHIASYPARDYNLSMSSTVPYQSARPATQAVQPVFLPRRNVACNQIPVAAPTQRSNIASNQICCGRSAQEGMRRRGGREESVLASHASPPGPNRARPSLALWAAPAACAGARRAAALAAP